MAPSIIQEDNNNLYQMEVHQVILVMMTIAILAPTLKTLSIEYLLFQNELKL
jgi:hypothetical protein